MLLRPVDVGMQDTPNWGILLGGKTEGGNKKKKKPSEVSDDVAVPGCFLITISLGTS